MLKRACGLIDPFWAIWLDLIGIKEKLTRFWCGRLANKLFLKVADLAAIDGNYYKSIENYEKVAKSSISNTLMKWSVKDYFLKAGICHLAANVNILQSNICVLSAMSWWSLAPALHIIQLIHPSFPRIGYSCYCPCPRKLPRP